MSYYRLWKTLQCLFYCLNVPVTFIIYHPRRISQCKRWSQCCFYTIKEAIRSWRQCWMIFLLENLKSSHIRYSLSKHLDITQSCKKQIKQWYMYIVRFSPQRIIIGKVSKTLGKSVIVSSVIIRLLMEAYNCNKNSDRFSFPFPLQVFEFE